MAKWCQKWPHLCQFEIKDHPVVWTSAVNVLSNLPPSAYLLWPLGAFLFLWVKRLPAHTRIYVKTDSSAYSVCLWSGGIPSRCLLLRRLVLESVPLSPVKAARYFASILFFFLIRPFCRMRSPYYGHLCSIPLWTDKLLLTGCSYLEHFSQRHQRVDHEPHLATSPSYPSAAKHPGALIINSVTTLSFNLN